jgi:hypothetical protein
VLVFRQQEHGPDALLRFTAVGGLADVHRRLLAAEVPGHMQPTADGVNVYVALPQEYGDYAAQVAAAEHLARHYGSEVEVSYGRGNSSATRAATTPPKESLRELLTRMAHRYGVPWFDTMLLIVNPTDHAVVEVIRPYRHSG